MPSTGTGASAPAPRRWWTLNMAAEYLGLDIKRIQSLCDSGLLDVRVDRCSVERLTKSRVGFGDRAGRRVDRRGGAPLS
jgi:hypothetical protein